MCDIMEIFEPPLALHTLLCVLLHLPAQIIYITTITEKKLSEQDLLFFYTGRYHTILELLKFS